MYVGLSLSGALLLLLGSGLFGPLGSWLFLLSLIAYVVLLVHVYRVQRDLRAAGLSRVGAWVVVVVPLLLVYTCRSFEPPLTNGKVLLIVIGSLFVPGIVLSTAVAQVRRQKSTGGG